MKKIIFVFFSVGDIKMSDHESESEDYEELSDAGKVAEALEEYEQEQKKQSTRKKRIDAFSEKEEIVISKESLSNLILTKKQIAQLKREQKERDKAEVKERTEKQKQQLAELHEKKRKQMDLRKSKEEEGITLKINKAQIRKKPAEKPVPKVKEVIVEDDDEPSYQGKKPDLEIEEKVQKLNRINQVIESQNPYLAMIMKNRR
jgi:hypothetical protein